MKEMNDDKAAYVTPHLSIQNELFINSFSRSNISNIVGNHEKKVISGNYILIIKLQFQHILRTNKKAVKEYVQPITSQIATSFGRSNISQSLTKPNFLARIKKSN